MQSKPIKQNSLSLAKTQREKQQIQTVSLWLFYFNEIQTIGICDSSLSFEIYVCRFLFKLGLRIYFYKLFQ